MGSQLDARRARLLLAGRAAPPGQALRVLRLLEDYPQVDIISCEPWQVIVTEPDGERTIVRWELSELLDELDRRLADLARSL
ncbi:MAG: hypothetical protein ACRDOH_28290 [Streptosporangiaceae bacterium]